MGVRNVTLSFLSAATMLMAETAQDRLKEAGTVFTEIMGTPEKGIPEGLLGKAHCVVIIPGGPKLEYTGSQENDYEFHRAPTPAKAA